MLFFNEGNNIDFCKYTSQYQRYYFVTLKCWMSLGSCLLCLMELYGLIACVSFTVYYELAKIKKRQKSLGVHNKISELCRS
jgi:hypothetical protein